jgi:hypothetical protein
MPQETPTAPKRDWKDIIEKSNGSLMLVPESLIPVVKDWNDKREELVARINELGKLEAEATAKMHNAILAARNYLDAAGQKDIWSADVGFELAAIKEGIFVINISRPQQNEARQKLGM